MHSRDGSSGSWPRVAARYQSPCVRTQHVTYTLMNDYHVANRNRIMFIRAYVFIEKIMEFEKL